MISMNAEKQSKKGTRVERATNKPFKRASSVETQLTSQMRANKSTQLSNGLIRPALANSGSLTLN
uniref:Uncharacterized protein n=1 Tax=Romanomermis culicivorax TaxID=13658 RepID=A0A915K974_ROMCU